MTNTTNAFSSHARALGCLCLVGISTFARVSSAVVDKATKGAVPIAVAPPQPLGNPDAPQGGEFLFNLQGEPPTLNPLSSTDLYSRIVQKIVMDTLLEPNDETNDWAPRLAERAEVSTDGLVYTFYLRQNAMWSDGKPVTAEDVKFSFDAIFDDAFNAASLRPYFENFSRCEIVDAHTVRFFAKSRYFGNVNALGDTFLIAPKHIYGDAKASAQINKTLIGSGPYVIEKYDQGQRLVLARNKNWWGNSVSSQKGRFNFSKILMRFVKDETVALEMLKKGELDFQPLTPEQFVKRTDGPEWTNRLRKVKAENKTPKPYLWIGWNPHRAMFADRNVRLALQLLMNREEMNTKFNYGLYSLTAGPWYPQSEYADPKLKPVSFDPKKAAALLAMAGWRDSDGDGTLDKLIDGKKVDFAFTLLHANKNYEKYLTTYQEDLGKAGVKLDIKLLEWNSLQKALSDRAFDAVQMLWGGGDVDLDPKQIWHSSSSAKGGSNYVDYKNPEVDALIDKGRAELAKPKRIEIFRKVYDLIAADQPYAFLFGPRYLTYAVTKRIGRPKEVFMHASPYAQTGWWYWWVQQ